jgi:hypothetical protein
MEGVLFSAEGAEPVRAMGEGADEEEVAELLYRRLTGVGAVESH